MGMYTQLVIGVELKEGTQPAVIDMLRYMVGDGLLPPLFSHLPQNVACDDFFDCSRWGALLRCDSYYFDWDTKFTFNEDTIRGPGKSIWCLTGSSNLKNYSGEIAKFLIWIAPHLDTGGDYKEFLGFLRYEEDVHPTLIYNDRGIITFVKVEGQL